MSALLRDYRHRRRDQTNPRRDPPPSRSGCVASPIEARHGSGRRVVSALSEGGPHAGGPGRRLWGAESPRGVHRHRRRSVNELRQGQPLCGLAGAEPLHDRDPCCVQVAALRRRHEHHRRHRARYSVVPNRDSTGADRRLAPAHRGDTLAHQGARRGSVAGRAAGDAAGARHRLDDRVRLAHSARRD